MLSSSQNTSPRPRPPAKMRRSATLQPRFMARHPPSDSSPPPYQAEHIPSTPSLPTLLGSPISVTSHLMRSASELPPQPQPTAEFDEWMNERSRAELSDLLLKAETIIHDRETELGRTSAVCKTLFENNVLLKSKHDAIVSRLPTSPPSSPSPPSRGSSTPAHSRASSIQSVEAATWSPMEPAPRRRRHGRQVSTSRSELALLADQNSELLLKLQDLEAEADRADQAGRRQLRELEREIRGLQDELERTRERSERLEEEKKASDSAVPPGLDGDLLKLWKKLDREAKVRALKAKTRPWEDEQGDETPKDFAPGSANTTPTRQPLTPKRKGATSAASPSVLVEQTQHSSPSFTPSHSRAPSLTYSLGPSASVESAREFALVSQLLLKVRELEEANNVIAEQHENTRVRLERAEQEAERVKRMYETISDEAGVSLEMVIDGDDSFVAGGGDAGGSTIRFRSIKNSSLNLNALLFSEDIGTSSTVRRNAGAPALSLSSDATQRDGGGVESDERFLSLFQRGTQSTKLRGSLDGLFTPSGLEHGLASDTGSSCALSSMSKPRRGALPPIITSASLPPDSGTPTIMSTCRSDTPSTQLRIPSPIERIPTMGSDASFNNLFLRLPSPLGDRKTLGSELGDAPFGFGGGSTRLRRSASLCEYIGSATTSDATEEPLSEVVPSSSHDHSRADTTIKREATSSTKITPPQGKRSTVLALIMEIWLWLQFAVIVTVFVYAMARRGPKHVLKHAQAKKNGSKVR